MGDFERDTRVSQVEAGHYTAELSRDWEIWGPNGGYLCAIALRAAGCEAQIPRPVALYCHYLRVAKFAPVELRVDFIARGRRSESLRVSMHQEEKIILEAMVRTAVAVDGLAHASGEAPSVAEPEAAPSAESLLASDQGPRHAFWGNFDVRVLSPERFASPRPKRPPHWLEWYRVHCAAGFDDAFVDAGRSALLLDTLGWPAACQPHPDAGFIAPSLDVAVWFHAREPGGDWVLAEAHSPIARDGTIAATGRLFSRDGTLLASSGTQMLCIPSPA